MTEHKPAVTPFSATLGVFQAVLFALLVSCVDYRTFTAEDLANGPNSVTTYYQMYKDVSIMVLLGFGLLMSFLRRFTFAATGYTFLITAVAFQWGILVVAFFEYVAEEMEGHHGKVWKDVGLSVKFLVEGMFAAATVLVSFGATLGVSTPTQLLAMTFIEVIFYGLNLSVGLFYWGTADIGGSIFIHTFGAFFGLACSWVMTPTAVAKGQNNKDACSTRTTDTFAMIGTIFLWLHWPSFNGVFSPAGAQHRVIINTVLSLSGSAAGTFLFSSILMGGKFEMVHIQNATLAGGVAIGSAADLIVGPGFAVLIGFLASFLSTAGYVYLSPFLAKRFNLHDTCGILNLHGIPGVLGAIAGAISVGSAGDDIYGQPIAELFPKTGTSRRQAEAHVGALGIALLLSIVGGLTAGAVMKAIRPRGERLMFQEDGEWEIPKEDEISAKDARKNRDRKNRGMESRYRSADVPFEDSEYSYASASENESPSYYTATTSSYDE